VWALCEPLAWPPASVWPALLLTGGIATAAAFFVQTYVQQRLSAVETGMIILTEPIFAVIFGQLLMGDRLATCRSWAPVDGGSRICDESSAVSPFCESGLCCSSSRHAVGIGSFARAQRATRTFAASFPAAGRCPRG
jgi:hypothetical protein